MTRNRFSRIALFLIMVMLVSFTINTSPVNAATFKDPESGITANVSSDGTTLTVSGSGMIPQNFFSASKPKIAYFNQNNLSKITTVIIDGNITDIGPYAFSGCVNLKTVTIKSTTLRNIYYGAFYKSTTNAVKITKVTIPSNVKFVQSRAFNDTTILECPNNFKVSSGSVTGREGYKVKDSLSYNALHKGSLAFDMLTRINSARSVKLTMDGGLMEIAMKRAAENAALNEGTGVISHIRPDGSEYFALQPEKSNYITAEVTGRGPTSHTVATVLSNLKATRSNKTTLEDSIYKSVGIGCVQVGGQSYWVICLSEGTAKVPIKTWDKTTEGTIATEVPFPSGTNQVNVDGKSHNFNFKIKSNITKVESGTTDTKNPLKLTLGNIELKNVLWSSDNSSIATVNGSGIVTGKGFGRTTIRAASTQYVMTDSGLGQKTYKGTNRASYTIDVYQKIRVAGDTMFETAHEAAKQLKSQLGVSKFKNIVVAFGGNFPDALSGTYLAVMKNAPIILVNDKPKRITQQIEFIKSNLSAGGTVYILGGTAAVSQTFEDELNKVTISGKKCVIKRLQGFNMYGTNEAILEEAGINGKPLLICTGSHYADSLSVSGLGMPILLIRKSGLKQDQLEWLKEHADTNQYYLIGGSAVIPDSVVNQIKSINPSAKIERLAGENMYGTNKAVIEEFYGSKLDTVTIVYSMNFPDGLAGGPVAAAYKSPIVLARYNRYTVARDYAKSRGARRAIIMGGTAVIPDATANNIIAW